MKEKTELSINEIFDINYLIEKAIKIAQFTRNKKEENHYQNLKNKTAGACKMTINYYKKPNT